MVAVLSAPPVMPGQGGRVAIAALLLACLVVQVRVPIDGYRCGCAFIGCPFRPSGGRVALFRHARFRELHRPPRLTFELSVQTTQKTHRAPVGVSSASPRSASPRAPRVLGTVPVAQRRNAGEARHEGKAPARTASARQPTAVHNQWPTSPLVRVDLRL
jgi:hypothetical protein